MLRLASLDRICSEHSAGVHLLSCRRRPCPYEACDNARTCKYVRFATSDAVKICIDPSECEFQEVCDRPKGVSSGAGASRDGTSSVVAASDGYKDADPIYRRMCRRLSLPNPQILQHLDVVFMTTSQLARAYSVPSRILTGR